MEVEMQMKNGRLCDSSRARGPPARINYIISTRLPPRSRLVHSGIVRKILARIFDIPILAMLCSKSTFYIFERGGSGKSPSDLIRFDLFREKVVDGSQCININWTRLSSRVFVVGFPFIKNRLQPSDSGWRFSWRGSAVLYRPAEKSKSKLITSLARFVTTFFVCSTSGPTPFPRNWIITALLSISRSSEARPKHEPVCDRVFYNRRCHRGPPVKACSCVPSAAAQSAQPAPGNEASAKESNLSRLWDAEKSHNVLRLEMKGGDNSMRIRQVRVLGKMDGESLKVRPQHSAHSIQQRNTESETLRVFRLITSQGKLSEAWANVTKGAIAENVLNLTRLSEAQRSSNECLRSPTLWLALASLCVLDRDHVERLSSGQWRNTADGKPPPPRVCKEEEEAIKVDLHEGCGRTKLFWALLLADCSTLKALVEFREGARAQSSSLGVCRFCGASGSSGLLSIGNVCVSPECQVRC
ncbi:unnamed protein product [Nesidiocoris tenuis]|uniref:Uncharacterized protein n=1 Tax=Nesidiocoris tenuis TaxID=355587 RepID=A0A6H5H142_9HEMI|nr:unnamed protein product [Nesidiocoris tenuis]